MLEIQNLSLRHHGSALLYDMNVRVAPGSVVTIVGPSGSGKSTVLNWLVGDLDPAFEASGALWLNGRRCDDLPIEQRRIGILFQDDLLFPHLSVGGNLAMALPKTVQGAKERRARVEQTLQAVGLAGLHDRDPATLSGGQRARVSLMRALMAEPQALLLDEPFARLDATLRTQFRQFVFAQIRAMGIPTLLVTHDLQDVPPGGDIHDVQTWSVQSN
jgi:putative thiamine transport system ATP-binding protein